MLVGAHRNVYFLNEKPALHLSLNQDICKIRMLLCFMGKRPAEARVPLSVEMLLWGGRCPAPHPRAGRKREEGHTAWAAPWSRPGEGMRLSPELWEAGAGQWLTGVSVWGPSLPSQRDSGPQMLLPGLRGGRGGGSCLEPGS